MCGLNCSGPGDQENTRGDLVTGRFAGEDEVIGVILFVGIEAFVRPTVGVGVKTLEVVGKRVRQSSLKSVPSMCLCGSAMSSVD